MSRTSTTHSDTSAVSPRLASGRQHAYHSHSQRHSSPKSSLSARHQQSSSTQPHEILSSITNFQNSTSTPTLLLPPSIPSHPSVPHPHPIQSIPYPAPLRTPIPSHPIPPSLPSSHPIQQLKLPTPSSPPIVKMLFYKEPTRPIISLSS